MEFSKKNDSTFFLLFKILFIYSNKFFISFESFFLYNLLFSISIIKITDSYFERFKFVLKFAFTPIKVLNSFIPFSISVFWKVLKCSK